MNRGKVQPPVPVPNGFLFSKKKSFFDIDMTRRWEALEHEEMRRSQTLRFDVIA